MFETKSQFLNWLSTQNKFSIKLHLTRVKRACELLGEPQKKLKTIHIAGTNGKGSTCNYISSLLISSGFKVGMYISPYIITFNERIQINKEYISDEDLVSCANEIMPVIEQVEQEMKDEMTEFEIITLLSFIYFNHKDVDYVIYEVGLGGRYDATNVIKPIVTGITNISYDHMGVLGDTLEKVGYEKVGIAKPNTTLFTTEENASVLNIFENYCEEVSSKLEIISMDEVNNYLMSNHGMKFNYHNLDLFIPMLGLHQLKNALLALKIYEFLMNARKFTVLDEYIYNGLLNSKWGGRLEIIRKNPLVIIDGSHNIDGVKTLSNAMKYYLDQGYKIKTIFAALSDKETDKMLSLLQSISVHLTLTSFNYYRANTAVNLYEQTNKINVSFNENYLEVLTEAMNNVNEDELLLITGSLYFIAKVINFFKTLDKDC